MPSAVASATASAVADDDDAHADEWIFSILKFFKRICQNPLKKESGKLSAWGSEIKILCKTNEMHVCCLSLLFLSFALSFVDLVKLRVAHGAF